MYFLSRLLQKKCSFLIFILGILFLSLHLNAHAQAPVKGNKGANLPSYKVERKEDSAAIKAYFKRQAQEKKRQDSIQKNITLDYIKSLESAADTVTELTISSSTLAVLPESIRNFKQLKTLKLFRCKSLYLRDLFDKLSALPNLENLDIVFSEKTEIPNNIYKLSQLQSLNISNNKIRRLPDSIIYLKQLRKINLMHNPYLAISNTFDVLSKMENLHYLDFSFSQLDTLPENIGRLKNIEHLDLSDNPFKEIPASISALTKLKKLNLNNCVLIDGQQALKSIGETAVLEELMMNGCKLKMIPSAISNLKKIKKLYFRNNLITDISGGIQELSNLEYLDISTDFISKDKNQLKDIPGSIGKCSKLKTLICTNNLLTGLPSSLDQTSLEYLDVSWNKIEKFPAVIVKLAPLKILNLSLNPINVIDENIGNLTMLENFQLAGDFRLPSKSKISKIPESIGLCKNLKTLNLRDHVISVLPESLFGLNQLSELNVMDNLLTTISSGVSGLKQLKNLNIKANELATFPMEVAQLKNLEYLNIAYNPALDYTMVFSVLSQIKSLRKVDVSYNEVSMAQAKDFQKTIDGLKVIKLELVKKVTRDEIMKEEDQKK